MLEGLLAQGQEWCIDSQPWQELVQHVEELGADLSVSSLVNPHHGREH